MVMGFSLGVELESLRRELQQKRIVVIDVFEESDNANKITIVRPTRSLHEETDVVLVSWTEDVNQIYSMIKSILLTSNGNFNEQ